MVLTDRLVQDRTASVWSATNLILATPIARIVFAWREPSLFVDCEGAELLRAAGREVVEVPELAHLVRRTNAHLVTRIRE